MVSKGSINIVSFIKLNRCGHCQRLAPTWEELASVFKESKDVHIIKVDCTENKDTCKKQGVRGYPTLLLFETGEAIGKYEGARDLKNLMEFVKKNMADNEEVDEAKIQEKSEEDLVGVVMWVWSH